LSFTDGFVCVLFMLNNEKFAFQVTLTSYNYVRYYNNRKKILKYSDRVVISSSVITMQCKINQRYLFVLKYNFCLPETFKMHQHFFFYFF